MSISCFCDTKSLLGVLELLLDLVLTVDGARVVWGVADLFNLAAARLAAR